MYLSRSVVFTCLGVPAYSYSLIDKKKRKRKRENLENRWLYEKNTKVILMGFACGLRKEMSGILSHRLINSHSFLNLAGYRRTWCSHKGSNLLLSIFKHASHMMPNLKDINFHGQDKETGLRMESFPNSLGPPHSTQNEVGPDFGHSSRIRLSTLYYCIFKQCFC